MPAPMINRTIPVTSCTPKLAPGATTPPKRTPGIDGMAARSFLAQGSAALPGLPAGLNASALSATAPGGCFEPAPRLDITSYVTGAMKTTVNHPERKRDINPFIPGNSVKMLA